MRNFDATAMFAVNKVYNRSKKVRFPSTTLLRFCGHLSPTTGEQRGLSISTICVVCTYFCPPANNVPCPLPPTSTSLIFLSLAVDNGKDNYTQSACRITEENAWAKNVVGFSSSKKMLQSFELLAVNQYTVSIVATLMLRVSGPQRYLISGPQGDLL